MTRDGVVPIEWCVKCGIYRARESDGYICPVCRDEARLLNEALYKELGS